MNTPDLMPLISRIFEHYLGINPAPERLHYRFELEEFPPEALLQVGESTASDYHETGRRRILLPPARPLFPAKGRIITDMLRQNTAM